MFNRLWAAVNRLIAGLESLATTVQQIDTQTRSRLQLDQVTEPAVIDHEPAEDDKPTPATNGTSRRRR